MRLKNKEKAPLKLYRVALYRKDSLEAWYGPFLRMDEDIEECLEKVEEMGTSLVTRLEESYLPTKEEKEKGIDECWIISPLDGEVIVHRAA